MSTIESRKRKHEADLPRITFIAPKRTFERLLKENSLKDLRSNVIKKLGLNAEASLELSQFRDGKSIDLEDEDDFEAFESYAMSNGVAEVRVNILRASEGTAGVESSQRTMPSSLESSRAMPRLGVMSPASQANENSGPDNVPVVSLYQVPKMMSDIKDTQTHQSENESSTAALAGPSTVDSPTQNKAAEAPQNKKSQSSKTEKISKKRLTAKQVQKDMEGIINFDGSSLEKTDGTKSKRKNVKLGLAADHTINLPDTIISSPNPSVALTPVTELPVPGFPPKSAKPARPKQSKKQKTSVPSESAMGTDTSHKQSTQIPTTTVPPGGQDSHEQQQMERRPDNTKLITEPEIDNKRSKKRKLEPDSKTDTGTKDAKVSSKSKRRKTDDNNAAATTAVASSPEANANPSTVQEGASVPAPSKSSKSKKKSKPTPEEMSQYDADLDSVVHKILAKRVSASSKQTASSAHVTIPASSVSSKQLSEGEGCLSEGGADPAMSKSERRNMSKKAEFKSTASQVNSAVDEQAHHSSAENSKSVSPPTASRPNDGERGKVDDNSIAVTSADDERPSTVTAKQFANFGTIVSDVLVQSKDEGSSSDSDSSSEYSDSHDNELAKISTTPGTREGGFSRDIPPPGRTDSLQQSDLSFQTGNLGANDFMEIDALTKPNVRLSWRDIPMSLEEDNDDEKLMSDQEEEEEEEEVHRRPSQNISAIQRDSSSSSYDDDAEDVSGIASDAEPALGADSRATNGTVTREGTEPLKESSLLTGTRSTSSEQLDEVENHETVACSDGHDKDASSQLPLLTDVDARGESVATEGVVNAVVDQIMEEDHTLILSSLDRSSRGASAANRHKTRQLVGHRQPSLLDQAAGSEDGGDTASELLKQSEDRNSIQIPYTLRSNAEKVTSQVNSDNTIPASQSNLHSQNSKPVPKASRTGTPGMVKRMRGRNAEKAAVEQSAFQSPLSRQFSDPRPTSSEFPINPQDFATSTIIGDRRQPSSSQSVSSDVAGLPSRNPKQQRKGLATAVSKSDESRKGKFRDASPDALSSASHMEVDKLLRTANDSAAPATNMARIDDDTAPHVSIGKELQKHKAPETSVPTSAYRGKSEDHSGSTTEVEQSVSGDKDSIILPSGQRSGESASLKQRSASPASVPGSSGSDNEDNVQLQSEQSLSNVTSRASLASAPRLSEIASLASRRDLFSPSTTPRPSLVPTKTFGSQATSGNNDEDDDDDDSSSSSSDSDSDSGRESHIPEEKRAGHTVSQSKTGRFRSMLPFL